MNNVEKIRAKWERGELCVGAAVTLSDPTVSELLADAGYDFLWIDMEHAPLSLETALGHVMAARGTDTAVWIRVPSHDRVPIKPILELHPAAVIVPRISNADQVADAVAACRYPPNGVRGYGPRRGIQFGGMPMQQYVQRADQQTMVIIQIEHIDALREMDAITAVPGVDSICVGPNDLSASMGLLGDPHHPDVDEAVEKIIVATAGKGIPAGIVGYPPQEMGTWKAKGGKWAMAADDFTILFDAARANIEAMRSAAST